MTETHASALTDSGSDESVAAAAARLRTGGLVAFATETVYGLGADATNGEAVARIYELKGRPAFNPLIVHVGDAGQAQALVELTDDARALADAFWPGPMTLVLRARSSNGIASLVTAGLETLAVRVPSHSVARALIAAAGCPIAAPSANVSGRISPTEAIHVREAFAGQDVPVLDGGASEAGLESTIIDLSGVHPVLLRPGTITRDAIAAVLGRPLVDAAHGTVDRPSAPGQLASHYAPSAAVRLDATTTTPGEGLLAFGPDMPTHDGPVINLSATGNLREAAAALFQALRTLDATDVATIAVMSIPEHGIGEAINDRLRRAAAPRS